MLIWTKDEPVKPGWYWMRQKDDFEDESFSVRIEYVREYTKRLCIMNSPIPDNAEWAGPIPLPGEGNK